MKILELPSPFYRARPIAVNIDTIIIHSMYADGTESPTSLINCAKLLEDCEVSAHYLISPTGEIAAVVGECWRARHAGSSKLHWQDDLRGEVNDFSIGIELLNIPGTAFPPQQMESLSELVTQIATRHPIQNITGHSQIAPGRKSDPGELFDWKTLKRLLCEKNRKFQNLRFPVDAE